MKEKKQVNAIVGLILLLIAIVLVTIIGSIGFIYQIIRCIFTRDRLGGYLYTVAVSLDQFGNSLAPALLDLVFKKGEGYKFGNPDTTVSGILGLNKRNNSLTKFGVLIDSILEYLDPNHSIASIDEGEEVAFGSSE